MENADNGCFMPIISSEKDSEIFFSKLSGTELLIAYLNNKGYTPSNKIFYYKNSLLDSGLLSIFFKDSSYNINLNLKSYLKDSRYPKNFSYAFHLFFTKEGLTPLILKAFESKHINVKHKHREKELEILFFENKQELYNSINKP
ncbi:hypothetical protein ACOWLG_02770 [Helicobacter pylori]